GQAMSEGLRPAVATWYSSGWNRWKLRRSTTVTSTGTRASACAAVSPPKPAPTISTCGRAARSEPYRDRLGAERLPARSGRERDPRRRGLLIDARPAPVADAVGEQRLQARPLRVAERDA